MFGLPEQGVKLKESAKKASQILHSKFGQAHITCIHKFNL
jgi:hypothetical protein